jgi:hypothetical protein
VATKTKDVRCWRSPVRIEREKERRGFLTLHLSSLADLGRETSLDSGNTSSRTTVVAGNEVQTVLTLVELGVRRFAGLASDILD